MHFITTISETDKRCVGYVSTLESALEVVTNNRCDINEAGEYPYAIIERINEGLYQYDYEPLWFKYNEKTHKYEASDRPEFIDSHLVGFGIG